MIGYFLAILSSCLLLISFYWVPCLIFVSFVPLFWVCYNLTSRSRLHLRPKSLKYTFISGFIFGAGLLYWVFVVEAPVKIWLWLGLIVLFIYFGFVFTIGLFLPIWLKRFYLIPVSWTFIEFARSLTHEVSFPWGSIGYALVPHLPFLQMAEFVGLPGITFFILTMNLLIFYAIQKKRLLYIYIATALILGVWGQGKIALRQEFKGSEKIRIGVLQPNVSHQVKRSGELDYRLSLLYELSYKALPCDLIIWPESAIPGYFNLGDRESRVIKLVDSLGTPVLMGGGRVEFSQKGRWGASAPHRIYNSCFLVAPGKGVIGSYDKIYLVPFSERLPFDDIFPVLKGLEFGQGSFCVGQTYKIFEVTPCHSERSEESPSVKFSTLICFESIFPRVSRRFVLNGARFLVNITDDSWFGRTAGPYQHANQSVIRAIECRTPLVRCGDTGLSFFLSAKGEIRDATELFTQRVIVRDIYLREDLTFYAKYGDWFAWLCGILLFIVSVRTLFARCRGRFRPG